ncbi:hypothetical protein PENTCL1PPCAC_18727, partial [Pristionchus entomophagus]
EITLDANAITRLGQLMSRHGVNYLELQFVRLDRISDDRRKNFAGLIGTSGVRFLEMNGLDHPCAGGIFNEQFMIDMANTHLERLYSDVTPNGSFPYRFKPSKAILPALCRLQCFDVPSMVLKSDWTVELIMAHRFYPRKSILPHLFRIFNLYTMVLRSEWFPALIKTHGRNLIIFEGRNPLCVEIRGKSM